MRTLLFTIVALILAACQSTPTPKSVSGESLNAWVEIDQSAFEKNIATLRSLLGPSGPRICAIMKADAYGHGLKLLAPSLLASGLPCVGIATTSEARVLRDAGFTGQILRVRTATTSEIVEALPLNVDEILGNLKQAEEVDTGLKSSGQKLRAHIALNSGGMSRNGLELKTASGQADAVKIARLTSLDIVGLMTHFAVEDKADVRKGLAAFQKETEWLVKNAGLDRSKLTLHVANSYATLEVPESRLDMVRPGGLFFGDTVPSRTEYLRAMSFKSRVAAVNSFPAGNTVSYDRTFTLKRPSRLANIPVGYSNGYRRVFSNNGVVLIRGRKHKVVGRVTMNTIMVDVTDAADVQPGDEVVLFGKQGSAEITQAELEKLAGTILLDLYTLWGESNPQVLIPTGGHRSQKP